MLPLNVIREMDADTIWRMRPAGEKRGYTDAMTALGIERLVA
jgi:hypothetical protein